MRRIITLMIVIFTAALVLHVAAQNKPVNDPFDTHEHFPARGQETKSSVTLCTGPILAADGSAKCLYQALPFLGKLRFEMKDGAIHEIDLHNVREMTVVSR